MARTTRSRRKMANTSDAPSTASSLLSSTTTTPFSNPTSTTYSTEDYTFNYSDLANFAGYSLDELNHTGLWIDVWNGTEVADNVTERLNATVLIPGGYCDEWEAAQHKLFQVSSCWVFFSFYIPKMEIKHQILHVYSYSLSRINNLITLKIIKFQRILLILYSFGEFIFDIVYIQSCSAKGLCSQ